MAERTNLWVVNYHLSVAIDCDWRQYQLDTPGLGAKPANKEPRLRSPCVSISIHHDILKGEWSPHYFYSLTFVSN